jgi:hypothetical protein
MWNSTEIHACVVFYFVFQNSIQTGFLHVELYWNSYICDVLFIIFIFEKTNWIIKFHVKL